MGLIDYIALILCIILLFTPAIGFIGFWWAGYVWEKHDKKKTQTYYVATTDADDED